MEHKTVVVEDFLNREIALKILNDSFKLYDNLKRNKQ
ncbi:MAG: hypothetical protein NDI80_06740 [Flavobacteriaceae bacterium]|nr:hypothetical protein [Flavobacteriaceae bacterium]